MKYAQLMKAIDSASHRLLGRAAAAVNQELVIRNWLIGGYIVQFQQQGQDRARYGLRLLERLAGDLAKRGLRGLDERALRDCRFVFEIYPQIRGTLSPEFRQFAALTTRLLSSTSSNPLARETSGGRIKIRGTLSPELPAPLSTHIIAQFSWSKLQELVRVDDPWKGNSKHQTPSFRETSSSKCRKIRLRPPASDLRVASLARQRAECIDATHKPCWTICRPSSSGGSSLLPGLLKISRPSDNLRV